MHSAFHQTLEDEDDVDASVEYMESVMRRIEEAKHTATRWLSGAQKDDRDASTSNLVWELLAEIKEIKSQQFLTNKNFRISWQR